VCQKKANIINEIMNCCGMPFFGVAPFDALASSLIQCGAKRRLPAAAKSVITAVFPYYCPCPSGEISRYARAKDYHIVAGEKLNNAAAMLREKFSEYKFEPFCDASPIPEVTAARLAGLGDIGCNGLLITPRFGSFVFIGEIVTNLELPECENPGGACNACGRCVMSCPAGAISPLGIDRERCVSNLTQKKGELSQAQRTLITKADTIWGCDICQNACPKNRGIETTYIAEFKNNIISTISGKDIDDENFEQNNSSRAFMWRGKEVLKRNLGILHGTPDNNIFEECKNQNRSL